MLAAYKNLVWSVINLVNAPRGRTYQQQRDRLLLKGQQRQQFIDAAQQITVNRLALGSLAELSLRLSYNTLAITAHYSHLARLTDADIVTCPLDTDVPAESAAPHLSWHRQIYRHTPAEAVLLAHPPHALALANAGYLPEPELMPAMWAITGDVSLLPATEATSAKLPTVHGAHGLLIPYVGILIWGDSLEDVITRVEALEYVSHLTIIARQNNLLSESLQKNSNQGGQ